MYNTKNQRQLIDIFAENRDVPFTASQLVENLKRSMNRATIYRQLNALEEKNIIRKNFNNQLSTYEYQYALDCENHFHLKCVHCGKIVHLQCEHSSLFMNHILQEHGFQMDLYSSTIVGLCKECSK